MSDKGQKNGRGRKMVMRMEAARTEERGDRTRRSLFSGWPLVTRQLSIWPLVSNRSHGTLGDVAFNSVRNWVSGSESRDTRSSRRAPLANGFARLSGKRLSSDQCRIFRDNLASIHSRSLSIFYSYILLFHTTRINYLYIWYWDCKQSSYSNDSPLHEENR